MITVGKRVRFDPTDYEGTVAEGPITTEEGTCWRVALDGDPTVDLIRGRVILLPESTLVELA
jgi:hypothetical protein